MLALYCGFIPRYCPNCGAELGVLDNNTVHDYNAMCSFHCRNCRLQYQQAKEAELLQAATDSGGDMAQYV